MKLSITIEFPDGILIDYIPKIDIPTLLDCLDYSEEDFAVYANETGVGEWLGSLRFRAVLHPDDGETIPENGPSLANPMDISRYYY